MRRLGIRQCRRRTLLWVRFRMQYRNPFRVLARVNFKLLPELGIFQSRLEPIHKAPPPRRRHCQPRLNFDIRHLMLGLWLDGLTGKVSEAGRESISKRGRHGFDEASAGMRGVDQTFALAAREKLAGSPSCGFAHVSVGTHLTDCGRARFDKNVASTFVTMKNDGTISSRSSEHGAFIPIRARVGVRLTLQPAAQQYQLRPSGVAPGLSSHAVPEDIHAAQRAERHNSTANKFQLRESLFRALDHIALPQTRSFGCLEHCRTANYSQ